MLVTRAVIIDVIENVGNVSAKLAKPICLNVGKVLECDARAHTIVPAARLAYEETAGFERVLAMN